MVSHSITGETNRNAAPAPAFSLFITYLNKGGGL